MGVEVGGDFGDLLEDLESFVFQVDGAEADGLELAQDAGDFAGFATEAPLAGEAGEIQGFPSIDEGGETAEIEGGVEFDGVGLKSGFAGKCGSDEVADFRWELGDIADGSGAGGRWECGKICGRDGRCRFCRFFEIWWLEKICATKITDKNMMAAVKIKIIIKNTCYNYTPFCSMPMGYKKFRGKLG